VFITARAGTSLDDLQGQITPIADRSGGDVQTVAQFVGANTSGLDLLLNIVYVMLALAILIALLGIANTLSLAVHERRSELGLLRAVGETQRQVRSMLRMESMIISTFGTVLGIALGGYLGWALFATVADGGVTVPVLRLVVITVLGGLAGVLAGLRPARRAARAPVLEAIAAP
jgi:putative ABC transport system permease protein